MIVTSYGVPFVITNPVPPPSSTPLMSFINSILETPNIRLIDKKNVAAMALCRHSLDMIWSFPCDVFQNLKKEKLRHVSWPMVTFNFSHFHCPYSLKTHRRSVFIYIQGTLQCKYHFCFCRRWGSWKKPIPLKQTK